MHIRLKSSKIKPKWQAYRARKHDLVVDIDTYLIKRAPDANNKSNLGDNDSGRLYGVTE